MMLWCEELWAGTVLPQTPPPHPDNIKVRNNANNNLRLHPSAHRAPSNHTTQRQRRHRPAPAPAYIHNVHVRQRTRAEIALRLIIVLMQRWSRRLDGGYAYALHRQLSSKWTHTHRCIFTCHLRIIIHCWYCTSVCRADGSAWSYGYYSCDSYTKLHVFSTNNSGSPRRWQRHIIHSSQQKKKGRWEICTCRICNIQGNEKSDEEISTPCQQRTTTIAIREWCITSTFGGTNSR